MGNILQHSSIYSYLLVSIVQKLTLSKITNRKDKRDVGKVRDKTINFITAIIYSLYTLQTPKTPKTHLEKTLKSKPGGLNSKNGGHKCN